MSRWEGHFFLYSMAFISGIQRDTRTEPALVLCGVGHMRPRTLMGPSYSSASEEISIFCIMSFRRLCCFSSRQDISFILDKRASGSEEGHTRRVFFFSHALVMARLQPRGAAQASESAATCRLGHSSGPLRRPTMKVQSAPSTLYLYFCFLNSVSISVHLCDLACTRLHTSSCSSKPKTICFKKPCKLRWEKNKHVSRVKGQCVLCCQETTYFGTLAVGMDDDWVLVHSLNKPVRQLLFQCSVEVNLRSVSYIFSYI